MSERQVSCFSRLQRGALKTCCCPCCEASRISCAAEWGKPSREAERVLQVCPEASAPGDQRIEKETANNRNMVKYKLYSLLAVCFNALSYQVSDSVCALCRNVPFVADQFWWWGWQGAPANIIRAVLFCRVRASHMASSPLRKVNLWYRPHI